MTHHLSHLLMLVIPMVMGAMIFAIEWRRSADQPLAPSLWVTVAVTFAAGLVHGAVVMHHLHEDAVLGWAMAAMCVAQLTWSVALLLSPTRRAVDVGVLGNLAIVVLWSWTRAVGVPFGIAGGLRQTVGAWDAACTLLEVGAVLGGLVWVWQATGRPAVRVAVRSPLV